MTTATFDLITTQTNDRKVAGDEMIAKEKTTSTNLMDKKKAFQEASRDAAITGAMMTALLTFCYLFL